ncbi:MAG: hypothetical protein ACHQX3_10575, partial [Nitrospirales bacterium]
MASDVNYRSPGPREDRFVDRRRTPKISKTALASEIRRLEEELVLLQRQYQQEVKELSEVVGKNPQHDPVGERSPVMPALRSERDCLYRGDGKMRTKLRDIGEPSTRRYNNSDESGSSTDGEAREAQRRRVGQKSVKQFWHDSVESLVAAEGILAGASRYIEDQYQRGKEYQENQLTPRRRIAPPSPETAEREVMQRMPSFGKEKEYLR